MMNNLAVKTPSTIKRFDGRFEGEIDDVCLNCRFDVELTNGTKYEFKSYSEASVSLIPSSESFLKQHLSYLADTDDLNKMSYVFDANKMADRSKIVQQFQKMYQNNVDDIFNVIQNNQQLRSSLFRDNMLSPKQQLNQLISDTNSALYGFLKID